MKGIVSLIQMDFKLMLHNVMFRMMAVFLLLIIVSVNFFLPERTEEESLQIITCGMAVEGYPQVNMVVELEQMAAADEKIVGIWWENGEINMIGTALNQKQGAVLLNQLFYSRSETPIAKNYTQKPTPEVPFRLRFLPLFICFEAVVLGYLMGGVMMLTEKSLAVTKAMQVTTAGAFTYVIAKTLLFSVTGTVYVLLMVIFTIGIHFPALPVIGLTMVATALFTMLSLALTVFFRSLSNWFFQCVLVLGPIMLTLFTYLFPAFSTPLLRAIPAYPILFTYEKLLFGDGQLAGRGFEQIIGWTILCFAASVLCIHIRYLRPHKGA